MDVEVHEIEGQLCVVVGSGAPIVRDAGGARDLVEEALNHGASMVVVPATTLDEAFFQLRSGFAGELLQKFANYHLKIAVLGDISAHVDASHAFRDLVVESERGDSLYFVSDLSALSERLAALRQPARLTAKARTLHE